MTTLYDYEALQKENKKLEARCAKLVEVINELLDGLDANTDERCGLTNEQWEQRIRNAKRAIR